MITIDGDYHKPECLYKWPNNNYDSLKYTDKNNNDPPNEASSLEEEIDSPDFIEEKDNQLKNIVLEIKLQIEHRKCLHNKIVSALDQIICDCKNLLLRLNYHMRSEVNPLTSDIKKQIKSWEMERLKQELTFWEQTTTLQKDLREAVKDHSTTAFISEMLDVSGKLELHK